MSIERIREALTDPALNDKSAPVADVAEAICRLNSAARAVAIRELLAAHDALNADAERLDWLEAQINERGEIHLHDGNHPHGLGLGLRPGAEVRTLREAIDAAKEQA